MILLALFAIVLGLAALILIREVFGPAAIAALALLAIAVMAQAMVPVLVGAVLMGGLLCLFGWLRRLP